MIPRLTAASFHKFMRSGRTSPAICGCEDAEGNRVDDFVVKLRGGLDNAETGLLCELLASRLPSYFGLGVPEPAIVVIDSEFAELVGSLRGPGIEATRFLKSVGLNFGSRLLTGLNPWPVDSAIPGAMWQAASEVFTFDGLIQNPDRRFGNPNLLTRGDDIVVFDHEMAFSFLVEIVAPATPWRLESHRYLENHVFYRRLKSRPIDLGSFTALLAALPGPSLDSIVAEVPEEWNNENLGRIERHLREVAAHSAEFAEEVKRRLA